MAAAHGMEFFKNFQKSKIAQPYPQKISSNVTKLSNQHLPNDISFAIVDYLSPQDLLPLFFLNSKWNTLLNQEDYWQQRFLSQFPDFNLFDKSEKGKRGKTWKDLYALRYRYENLHQKWFEDLYHPEFLSDMGHVWVFSDKKVGSTTFHNCITCRNFDDKQKRDGEDMAIPSYNIGESKLTMYICQLPFSTHAVIDIILYLFDLSNPNSLKYILNKKNPEMECKSWYKDCQIVLIGLKKDLKEDNTLSNQAFDVCAQKLWNYFELSCKTDPWKIETVEHMFIYYTVQRILKQQESRREN